ncbi:MAG: dihydrofolate reductase [Pseudorhodoplanes sp.]
MRSSYSAVGYAIVSADGMLADSAGVMLDTLKYEADQHYFQSGLDHVAAVIHGRHSHEGGPRADRRRRLVVTRRIASLARDPVGANTLLWNPSGIPLEQALAELGVTSGVLGIIGGTDVFGMFLAWGYDEFHLSRAPPDVILPGGRPVFPDVSLGRSPERILEAHGLTAGPAQILDAKAGVSVTVFRR